MAETERSTEDIRQDIAREEEKFTRTAHQIGDRIKEKLDWSAYVKDAPYWSLGAAVGLGLLASKMLQRRTPMERIMGSLAEEVRGSLGGLHVGTNTGPSLIQVTLLGMATKVATDWIKNATSIASSNGGINPQPKAEGDSTIHPKANIN